MTTPPDETLRAISEVERRIALDPEATDRQLARLIAATLHSGPGTALYEFAANDELYPRDLMSELNRVEVRPEREAWVDALVRFLLLPREAQE